MKSGHQFCSRKRVYLKDIFSDLNSPTMDVAARQTDTMEFPQKVTSDKLNGDPTSGTTMTTHRCLPIMLHARTFRIIMGLKKLLRAKVFGRTTVPCIFITSGELERFKMTLT